jgi:hypothetical protein
MVKEEKKGGGAVKAGTNWKPAVVPTLALIVVGIVPGLLKGLYEPYAGTLMTAYVIFGLSFISLVLGGLAFMALRDLSDAKMTIFRLGPSEQPARGDEELVRIESREDGNR